MAGVIFTVVGIWVEFVAVVMFLAGAVVSRPETKRTAKGDMLVGSSLMLFSLGMAYGGALLL